jgi:hypothetical protein
MLPHPPPPPPPPPQKKHFVVFKQFFETRICDKTFHFQKTMSFLDKFSAKKNKIV